MKILKNIAGLGLAVFIGVAFGGCADKGVSVNGPTCVDTPYGKLCYPATASVGAIPPPPPALPPPVSYNAPLAK